MVRQGKLQVSKADAPQQGRPRDPDAPNVKGKGGSQSQTRAEPQREG